MANLAIRKPLPVAASIQFGSKSWNCEYSIDPFAENVYVNFDIFISIHVSISSPIKLRIYRDRSIGTPDELCSATILVHDLLRQSKDQSGE